MDASELWLLEPFHAVEIGDRVFAETVATIEERLTLDGGIRRYSTDVYFGSGAWPVLTASLGWYAVATGDLEKAKRCLAWIAAHLMIMVRLANSLAANAVTPSTSTNGSNGGVLRRRT